MSSAAARVWRMNGMLLAGILLGLVRCGYTRAWNGPGSWLSRLSWPDCCPHRKRSPGPRESSTLAVQSFPAAHFSFPPLFFCWLVKQCCSRPAPWPAKRKIWPSRISPQNRGWLFALPHRVWLHHCLHRLQLAAGTLLAHAGGDAHLRETYRCGASWLALWRGSAHPKSGALPPHWLSGPSYWWTAAPTNSTASPSPDPRAAQIARLFPCPTAKPVVNSPRQHRHARAKIRPLPN